MRGDRGKTTKGTSRARGFTEALHRICRYTYIYMKCMYICINIYKSIDVICT